LTQDPTKPTENIPPVPVTNDKAKDPEEKSSPIASKDLQDQFNNDPLVTDPNNNPPEKTPAETPTPTDAPAIPSYAAALTGHTTPTPEEDFLTQGGFTIHETDKRKRPTSTTVGCLYPVVEIYMSVDKDQYTTKSELLLELVIYSTSASVDVAVALSVRGEEDLSRE